jgi:hypothetical protein
MTPEQAAALRQPFPKSAQGLLPKPYKKESPKGNCPECKGYHGLPAVHLDYVGHAATTDRLLSVDPEWTWEPAAVDQFGVPVLDGAGNLWIKLTVCGVTRLGVGDGTSAKEKIGDAIRNAAMRFGVALDLWSKEELEQSHGPAAVPVAPTQDQPAEPPPPAVRTMSRAPAPASRDQITKIQAQFGDLGYSDRAKKLGRVWEIVGREVASSNDLTKAEASAVIGQLDLDLAAQVSA